MSEAAEHIEAPAEEAPAQQVEAAAQAEPTAEDQARKRGWRPKEEFEGPADKWVDADTFLKRGQEEPGLLRAELKAAERKIQSLTRDLRQLADHHSRTEERAFKRALAEIEARLDQAAASGDVDGVRAATDELVELRSEAKDAATHTAQPQVPAEMQEWMDENPWYGKDRALTAATQAIAQEVFEEGYTGKAQVREVDRRVREAFPAKFEKPSNPNRRTAPAVEGGTPHQGPRGKTRADLPADARATMDRWVKQGLMTEADYLKDYFS